MQENANRLVEQIRPFLNDDESYGRLLADVHDLMEICAWFLNVTSSDANKLLNRDELETLLMELDIRLVDHGLFHLSSLKKQINSALEKLADDSEAEKDRRGVA